MVGLVNRDGFLDAIGEKNYGAGDSRHGGGQSHSLRVHHRRHTFYPFVFSHQNHPKLGGFIDRTEKEEVKLKG